MKIKINKDLKQFLKNLIPVLIIVIVFILIGKYLEFVNNSNIKILQEKGYTYQEAVKLVNSNNY